MIIILAIINSFENFVFDNVGTLRCSRFTELDIMISVVVYFVDIVDVSCHLAFGMCQLLQDNQIVLGLEQFLLQLIKFAC